MPELPEVQSVCATLAPRILGRTVLEVIVRRRGVITGPATPEALLCGLTFIAIRRHGKQIALIAAPRGTSPTPASATDAPAALHALDARPALSVHLGMTGSLCHRAAHDPDADLAARSRPSPRQAKAVRHLHVLWSLDDGTTLGFHDPRRFGGIWTFPTLADLRARRWADLGPDALEAPAVDLFARLSATARPLKAALLDQSLLAGLGNIYVDELLFDTGHHPLKPANALSLAEVERLTEAMRALLQRAILAGGTTLRDYVDGDGRPGEYQSEHRVYGRSGLACVRCAGPLQTLVLAGRTTVACPACQPPPRSTPLRYVRGG